MGEALTTTERSGFHGGPGDVSVGSFGLPELQLRGVEADVQGMLRWPLLLLLLLLAMGCVMPAQGTPVFVDLRAGRFYSGEGMLHQVSDDQERCRVSVRDPSLVVRKRWVLCRYVHTRSIRDAANPDAL